MYKEIKELPDGDIKIEIEQVFGGWVGYVILIPETGAIVSADRDGYFARTKSMPTRLEAYQELPKALQQIKEKTAT